MRRREVGESVAVELSFSPTLGKQELSDPGKQFDSDSSVELGVLDALPAFESPRRLACFRPRFARRHARLQPHLRCLGIQARRSLGLIQA